MVDVVIDTYLPRSNPARFVPEVTDRGPELPGPDLLGLHRFGSLFLKAPEDVVPLVLTKPRHASRGDMDIILWGSPEKVDAVSLLPM